MNPPSRVWKRGRVVGGGRQEAGSVAACREGAGDGGRVHEPSVSRLEAREGSCDVVGPGSVVEGFGGVMVVHGGRRACG